MTSAAKAVVMVPVAVLLVVPLALAVPFLPWWVERGVRRRLARRRRTISVDAAAERLAAGEGTLIHDELSGIWWWSPERVEIPKRVFGAARSREEAEAIVVDLAVMRATRDRWCTEEGRGSLVVGSRRAVRGLGGRYPERVAAIDEWLSEDPSLDWRRWMAEVMCAECGYDLSGLEAVARCPECGGVRQRWVWQGGEIRGRGSVSA